MTALTIRFRGRLADWSDAILATRREPVSTPGEGVAAEVRALIDQVRHGGDPAVRALTRRFDNVILDQFEVPATRWHLALDRMAPSIRAALERSARNVAAVHRAMAPVPCSIEVEPCVRVERVPWPIERVGVYVPGGRAAYPSSVLMGVVPAKTAGCPEVVVCSPPGPGGQPAEGVLAACAVAGADRLFAIGGVQAVAAMALGTATVPRVDRIVGPGNRYVAEAKLQLCSHVGIDGPAGPSEVLIVADQDASLDLVARELVAQLEHDPDAVGSVVLVGPVERTERLVHRLEALVPETPRAPIVVAALAAAGSILAADTIEAAAAFANQFAPEHLLLAIADGPRQAARFRVAGAVFLGAASSVAFGDYLTGANHVLPTGGTARSYSGLGPNDFVRWTSYQTVDRAAAAGLAGDAVTLATAEGLPGHAAAAAQWLTEDR